MPSNISHTLSKKLVKALFLVCFSLILLSIVPGSAIAGPSLKSWLLNSAGQKDTSNTFNSVTSLGEPIINIFTNQNYNLKAGFISTLEATWIVTPILSISVNPKSWAMGSTQVNTTVTMTQANKITVTNDGTGPETLELGLIDPAGWSSSTTPGRETYVLSGLFCAGGDVPSAGSFLSEDVITTSSQKASATVFAYAQATANGVAVPAASQQSLYLQFKSPTITNKKTEQNISLIVSCQVP